MTAATSPSLSSSLIALHATFASEQAVLEQVVYKSHNQHRKANYYQLLSQVMRHNRRIDLQHLAEQLQQPPPPSSSALLLTTIDQLRRSTCATLRAAEPLYALLQQTYFMPLALTSLALLARLLVVIKQAMRLLATEAKEREERLRDGKCFALHSVGFHLLSALQQPKGELMVAAMDGFDLWERWQEDLAEAVAPVTTGAVHAPAPSAAVLEADDIPFFDVEPAMPSSDPPRLPLSSASPPSPTSPLTPVRTSPELQREGEDDALPTDTAGDDVDAAMQEAGLWDAAEKAELPTADVARSAAAIGSRVGQRPRQRGRKKRDRGQEGRGVDPKPSLLPRPPASAAAAPRPLPIKGQAPPPARAPSTPLLPPPPRLPSFVLPAPSPQLAMAGGSSSARPSSGVGGSRVEAAGQKKRKKRGRDAIDDIFGV